MNRALAYPQIESRRYKALRYFLRTIEPFMPGIGVRGRHANLYRLYRILGGADRVRARRYDKMEIVLAETDFARILNGAEHKRFGRSNFYPVVFASVWPGSVVVDVGAGMGDEVLDACQLVGPDGHVLAFEPDRASFDALTSTLALNGIANVEAFNAAVGARDGHLAVSGRIMGKTAQAVDTATESTVPMKTLDTIMAERSDSLLGQNNVSLLKIDTDGFDLDVLMGARQFLASNPRCKVIVEHLPSIDYSGHRGKEVIEVFRSLGFRVSAIQTAAVELKTDADIDRLYQFFDDPRHMISHDFLLTRD